MESTAFEMSFGNLHKDGVNSPLIVCGMMGTDVSILVYLVSIDY